MNIQFVKMGFPELICRVLLSFIGGGIFIASWFIELPLSVFVSYYWFLFWKVLGLLAGVFLFVLSFVLGYEKLLLRGMKKWVRF